MSIAELLFDENVLQSGPHSALQTLQGKGAWNESTKYFNVSAIL